MFNFFRTLDVFSHIIRSITFAFPFPFYYFLTFYHWYQFRFIDISVHFLFFLTCTLCSSGNFVILLYSLNTPEFLANFHWVCAITKLNLKVVPCFLTDHTVCMYAYTHINTLLYVYFTLEHLYFICKYTYLSIYRYHMLHIKYITEVTRAWLVRRKQWELLIECKTKSKTLSQRK